MAQNQKSYDNEFKAQAVKLAQEIGVLFSQPAVGSQQKTEINVYCNQNG